MDLKVIWIDVGPDFRQQCLRYNISDINEVILTHEHKDHIAGLDDLRPFIHLSDKPIQIHSLARVLDRIKVDFSYAFSKIKYPGAPSFNLLNVLGNSKALKYIEFYSHLHYKLPVLSILVKDILYVTDSNLLSKKLWMQFHNISKVVIGCLQWRDHLSHFNIFQVVEFADLFPQVDFILTHISHNLGLYNEVQNRLPSNVKLGYDGLFIPFSR